MYKHREAARDAARKLSNVIASPAPESVRIAASALLACIARGAANDDADRIDADAKLADAVADLPGVISLQVDFLRVLNGERAAWLPHAMRSISAALRTKARQLGRAPADEDFPADHPARLLALAYWGGIAAWSAGAIKRAQHPKGHWSRRENQIAALREAVARHPGVPVTHALLRAAGLYRMAVVLDAAQLALLADEAGVKRGLLYRPAGWWTPERVIDAYAAHCRSTGATLSSSALTAIGGEASSLRVHAGRHFGSFLAFQAAVTVRHPDIRPPGRPTTVDGTRLDSWSEVVAYNAVRAALPDVQIQVHVVLPGEPRRSARSGDFLINGCVWVEVLGLSRDAMEVASTRRQRKYASQWTAKLERYDALGVTPVVIEPIDIHDPQRLACRIAEIARQLGREPPTPPQPSGRSMRAKGSWTFKAVCEAVAEIAGTNGTLPTHTALIAAGYGHAAQLLRRPGERQRVATALGLCDPHAKGVWTRDRVVDELSAWTQVHGAFPSKSQLRHAGYGRLCSAGDRVWAGDRAGLRAAVENRCGLLLPPRRAANGSLGTPAQLIAALTPLADALGRMPSRKEAAEAGLSTAWTRASRTMGAAAMARLLGVRCVGPQRRSRTEMLREFADLAASTNPARLTTTMIRDAMGSGGLARVRRCGGIASVREQIVRMSSGGGQAG